LAATEGMQQLLLGVLKGRADRIYGGKRQDAPQEIAVRSKVLRSAPEVNRNQARADNFQIAEVRM
jgi:hypothetical protein